VHAYYIILYFTRPIPSLHSRRTVRHWTASYISTPHQGQDKDSSSSRRGGNVEIRKFHFVVGFDTQISVHTSGKGEMFMAKRIERRGRPRENPAFTMRNGTMTRIPLAVHWKIKEAAKAAGLPIGRFLVELGARAVGVELETSLRAAKKKSAA
jgi:hypothetical protein